MRCYDLSVLPTEHTSNQESVRPIVRPVLLRLKATIVLSASTSTLFIATTKETAKEGPTAMNRVDVVALNTIFVLRLSKTERTVGRTDSRLDGWSVGRTVVIFMTALRAASILKNCDVQYFNVFERSRKMVFYKLRDYAKTTSREKSFLIRQNVKWTLELEM